MLEGLRVVGSVQRLLARAARRANKYIKRTRGIVAIVVLGVCQRVTPCSTCHRALLCHTLQLGIQQLLRCVRVARWVTRSRGGSPDAV